MELSPNLGKNLIIEVDGKKFARYPVKTKLITPEDKDIFLIIKEYVVGHLKKGDIIFISEKAVSITQGRSYPKKDIKPSIIAKFLSSFVTRTPIGIGLGSPETMQLAIEELGLLRIFVAVFFSFLFKIFGIKGVFYLIAGSKARSIDGAVEYAIAPYNNYVSKGPNMPNKLAEKISKDLKTSVVIIDANDFGINILGMSQGVNKKLIKRVLRDNPLGQTNEQTPIGILRQV